MDKPGVSTKLREVLKQVSAYDNVPRKRAKFQVGVFSFCIFWIRLSDYYFVCSGNADLHA